MKSPLSLARILSVSSIVLLVALQVVWLRSAWRDAKDELTRTINIIFREVVFAQQDSLLRKSIQPADSLFPLAGRRMIRLRDSLRLPSRSDTVVHYFNSREDVRVEIFASGKAPDSLSKILVPLAQKLKESPARKRFIIRLGPDSLNVDSLTNKFQSELTTAGFQLSAVVRRQDAVLQTMNQSALVTGPVPINPHMAYVAQINHSDGLLVRKIMPQILFSVFLTALTIIAFYLLNRTLSRQQRLMEVKNDLISNISHELKTPIATVSVALEALRQFNVLQDPDKTKTYLSIAQTELSRLALLTDNVLRTALADEGRLQLVMEPVDLAQVVTHVTTSLQLLMENRKAILTTDGLHQPAMVHGSLTHLTSVVFNLLDNALKYSPENPRITVSLASSNGHAVLSVQDNGIGIPEDLQEKVFEKFFRVPHGDVHDTHGHGLGLHFVSTVVRQHGGTVRVISKPGQGSQFIIQIPLFRG
ncbi:MAG: HAMP domain-containing histidine kinase [Cyclobacteriaceae bacterium]|nr:HAMP domain-containing histidine kinase [Cyclobacteriaceae bacterium]